MGLHDGMTGLRFVMAGGFLAALAAFAIGAYSEAHLDSLLFATLALAVLASLAIIRGAVLLGRASSEMDPNASDVLRAFFAFLLLIAALGATGYGLFILLILAIDPGGTGNRAPRIEVVIGLLLAGAAMIFFAFRGMFRLMRIQKGDAARRWRILKELLLLFPAMLFAFWLGTVIGRMVSA